MDADLKKLVESYKYETDEELVRKRGVYRSFIISETEDEIAAKGKNLEENQAMYEALSEIIRKREKWKRFEGLLYRWVAPIVIFLLGAVVSRWWPVAAGGN